MKKFFFKIGKYRGLGSVVVRTFLLSETGNRT